MAVPKKKTSSRKRDQRRATWKRKARFQAEKAISLGKAVLSGRTRSFFYPVGDQDESEDTGEDS